MALWQKIAFTIFVLVMIYLLYPVMLAAMEKSKQAQEKHWGTVLILTAALVIFVLLLVSVVQ
jgi:lipopolysaccharide export LptBFGC system permease protein LptF